MIISESKKEFRKLAGQRRAQIKNRKEKSAEMKDKFLGWLQSADRKPQQTRIFLFLSFRSEPDTHELCKCLIRMGYSVAAPRIENGQMQFFTVTKMEELKPGNMNILEPGSDCMQLSPQRDDIMLVPGLAFDKRGRRIGYGGGYYDRYLSSCNENCLRIGYAFSEQIVDCVPAESWDVPVEAAFTQDGLMYLKEEDN